MRDRQPAICLRTTDYSETSQVAHFLTRGAGVVHVLAKGSKRPKSKTGGTLDVLAEGELVYSTGRSASLATLIEFTETTSHLALRRDVARLYASLYMLELAGELIAEDDPHPEVFDLLHNSLARLGEPDAPVEAVLAYYQWRLLGHVGLRGEMTTCVACGRPLDPAEARRRRTLHFSSEVGGLVCADCEPAVTEKYRIDADTAAGLAVLQAARRGQRRPFPPEQARAVSRLLAYHVTHQLGKPLKTAKYAIR